MTWLIPKEIRREALVKDWGAFVCFMQLAAAESGQIVNFAAISQESGVSQPTVKSYYQLLEDMFVGFRIEAISRSSRKARSLRRSFYSSIWACAMRRRD